MVQRGFVAEFGQNFTVHGTSFLVRRRYLPILCAFACASFGIWECNKTLTTYLEFGVKTKVQKKEAGESGTDYPAITFCPANTYIRSVVGGTTQMTLNSYLSVAGMSFAEATKWSKSCDEPTVTPVPNITHILSGWGFPAFMRYTTWDSHKAILSCLHRGRKFDCSRQFLNKLTDAGFCFTFNSGFNTTNSYALDDMPAYADQSEKQRVRAYGTTGEEGMKFVSKFSGPLSGIKFEIYANEPEYCASVVSCQTGFMAVVHDPDSEPILFTKQLLMLSPGYSHNVALSVRKSRRFTESLGYCSSQRFLKYNDPVKNVTYTSRDRYIVNCLSTVVRDKCRCFPFYMPPRTFQIEAIYNRFPPACSGTMVNCQKEQERIEMSLNGNCFRSLPIPCEETKYSAQITSTLLGYHSNVDGLKRVYQQHTINNKNLNLTGMSLEKFRNNFFTVNFYMKRSTYQLFTEKVAMTWVDLMNSVGGAIGMAVGMSLISITELIGFGMGKTFFSTRQIPRLFRQREFKQIPPYHE